MRVDRASSRGGRRTPHRAEQLEPADDPVRSPDQVREQRELRARQAHRPTVDVDPAGDEVDPDPGRRAGEGVVLEGVQVREPVAQRPRVIVRWGDAKDLLISGLLDGAGDIAERAAVVQAHYGKGHVLLFANNPIWRGETIGSWPLVFNAIVNFDRLDAAAPAAR